VLALTGKRLIHSGETIEDPVVLIEDKKIVRVGSRAEIEIPKNTEHRDFPDAIIAPGLLDLHIHGGAGHDVMEATDAAFAKICAHLAKTGVTRFLPTTVTASVDVTLRALEHLGSAIQAPTSSGAKPIGIHLEGPFISTAKCGVHPIAEIKPPDLTLLERFWEASSGTIKMVTLAPELPGAVEFTRTCVAKKIVVSLGHSNAGAVATKACIDAGARHATHTFNAMRSLDHREPGILGVVLSDDRVSADIIVDGVHVSPEMVRLFLRAKGDKAVLITDAISATGMPDGKYKLGGFEVEVTGDRAMHNGRLAGSVLTLDRAVRNVRDIARPSGTKTGGWVGDASRVPQNAEEKERWAAFGYLEYAVRMATLHPTRTLGNDVALTAPWKPADLVVLSDRGDVQAVISRGKFLLD